MFTCKEEVPVKREQLGKRQASRKEMVPLFAFSMTEQPEEPKKRARARAARGAATRAASRGAAKSVKAAKAGGSVKEVAKALAPANGMLPLFQFTTINGQTSVIEPTPGHPPEHPHEPQLLAAEPAGAVAVAEQSVPLPASSQGVLSTPLRPKKLSLDFLASGKRRCSIFKTRRESLFGYDQIYNGSILPGDFYKHSNESQDTRARAKQVLIWIIKYVANGHLKMQGISQERLQAICDSFIKKVPCLEIPPTGLPVAGRQQISPEKEQTDKELLASLRQDSSRYLAEIAKWKHLYSAVARTYTLSVPLCSEKESQRRLSLSIQRQSLGPPGLVSFEATLVAHSPNELQQSLRRRLEDLNTILNSSRYFMFLAMEYTKRVCASLVSASCSIDKPKANALLQLLCRAGRGRPSR